MFGFLIAGRVKEDARNLIKVTEQILGLCKASSQSKREFAKSLQAELTVKECRDDGSFLSVTVGEAPDFTFMVDPQEEPDIMTVQGMGKHGYHGFHLTASGRGSWFSSCQDGVMQRATAGARKMHQIMVNNHEMNDMDRMLGR